VHAVIGKLGPTRSTKYGIVPILGTTRSTRFGSQQLCATRTTKEVIIAVHAAARPTEHRSLSPSHPRQCRTTELGMLDSCGDVRGLAVGLI
jgi:hypothetical protein